MNKTGAIITAGGLSTRYGKDKLLEKIEGKSVIETTVLKFIDLVDYIVIPARGDLKNYIQKNIKSKKLIFAPFGSTRQKSVYQGLLMCPFDTGIILIHDGARPYILKEDIKNIIELTKEKKALCAGTMAIDTVKEIKNNKIIKTLNRENIFLASTPQAFEFNLIKSAHEKFKNENLTDDASLIEKLKIPVYPYITANKNIKITTKDDLI